MSNSPTDYRDEADCAELVRAELAKTLIAMLRVMAGRPRDDARQPPSPPTKAHRVPRGAHPLTNGINAGHRGPANLDAPP
jgi:hypothetical protein